MAEIQATRRRRKRKRKHAGRAPEPKANGARTPDPETVEELASLAIPVGRLERTRRLFLAALRVWELKRKVGD